MAQEVPNWVQLLQQQDFREDTEQLGAPVKLLKPPNRGFVWSMCHAYNAMEDGVMGQACNLLERYIAKKVQELSRYPAGALRDRMKLQLTSQVPLLVSVCISLSTVMLNKRQHISHRKIREHLSELNIQCTMDQINNLAFDVLQRFDFALPLFTNVQKAMMFAIAIGMSGSVFTGIPIIVDLAEYYRSVIQEDVLVAAYAMGTIRNDQRYANLRHLHLVGGSVLAASRLFKCYRPEYIEQLCILSRCHRVYLKCIGDVVQKRIFDNAEDHAFSPSRKRKYPY